MRTIARRPPPVKPDGAEDEDHERQVVHAFRSRADRLVEFGFHRYRGLGYLDITTIEILPGGGHGQRRRMSLGVHLFADFLRGVLALEQHLRQRGEL